MLYFYPVASSSPIGIFDSGVGGLTVARAIKDLLPKESIIYFGDTLHLPYGEKSPESIRRYSSLIADFLVGKGCKLIVIACNSASSLAYESTRSILPETIELLNVIDPMVELALSRFQGQNVGIIGTRATIKSGIYQKRLQEHLNINAVATPLLAPMIEEGFIHDDVSMSVAKAYLGKEVVKDWNAMILGCTHYPIIQRDFEVLFGGKTEVLSSSIPVARECLRRLESRNLLNEAGKTVSDLFFVSDYTESFENLASKFFGDTIHLEEARIT
jgi:glutamate racemase